MCSGSDLASPRGLAVDRSGNWYLLDAGNSRLVRFATDLAPSKETGGFGSAPGFLDDPDFVTIDNDLNLLVSDVGNRRIARYNTRLEYADALGFYDDDDPLAFGEPTGVGVTGYGEVWVADFTNSRIAVFDNVGRFDRHVGGFGYRGGQLQEPGKIIRMPSERFLVCDAGNSRLVLYDQYGNYEREIKDREFDYPVAAALDHDVIWVLDAGRPAVTAIDRSGHVLFLVGPTVPGAGKAMSDPHDICVLPDNRLVISDTGNNRLLVCRIVRDSQ